MNNVSAPAMSHRLPVQVVGSPTAPADCAPLVVFCACHFCAPICLQIVNKLVSLAEAEERERDAAAAGVPAPTTGPGGIPLSSAAVWRKSLQQQLAELGTT